MKLLKIWSSKNSEKTAFIIEYTLVEVDKKRERKPRKKIGLCFSNTYYIYVYIHSHGCINKNAMISSYKPQL